MISIERLKNTNIKGGISMFYPEFIKEKDTIGITALSNGVVNKLKINRLENAHRKLQKKGYHIIETDDVRKDRYGKSAPSKVQAKELEELYLKKEVKLILIAAGGDFLMETLPYIDFSILKENPKWIQGYSDPTLLLFYITTHLDIATIYASNACTFGMDTWHESLEDNFKILEGKLLKQTSFEKYEQFPHKEETGLESYNLDKDVYWNIITEEEKIETQGRIIGGCLDSLSDIFGTRFDETLSFIEKYKEEGIVWYFDVCELTSEALIRTLWKFREAGWFQYTKCILFSRIIKEESFYGISYSQAIKNILEQLHIPVAINCDFGHVSPRMTMINGSIANIKIQNGKGEIFFELK